MHPSHSNTANFIVHMLTIACAIMDMLHNLLSIVIHNIVCILSTHTHTHMYAAANNDTIGYPTSGTYKKLSF